MPDSTEEDGQVTKWVGPGEEAFLPRRSSSWAQTVRTHISLLTTYTRRRLGDKPGMLSATPLPTAIGKAQEPRPRPTLRVSST